MKNLVQVIKSIRLTRILTIFLAGSLLVVSTACSQGNIAQLDENQSAEAYISYTDNNRSSAESEAKARALIDGAKSRQNNDLGDYVDNITDGTQETIKEAKENIQETTSTLKNNVGNAADEAREVFDEATDTAKNALEDATRATQNKAKELKSNFPDLT